MPGFVQRKNNGSDELLTGEYYWIDELNTTVTNESSTYWQPFSFVITNYSQQMQSVKLNANFVLNGRGEWFPGESVTGGRSQTTMDGVICKRRGVYGDDIVGTTPELEELLTTSLPPQNSGGVKEGRKNTESTTRLRPALSVSFTLRACKETVTVLALAVLLCI
ncbi:hypothetical protein EB796_015219 [Bugula neritina]|uniref:Uncharacterized protein n=1 Tax=Bugula neritina TaxID=10212 RepID=A0A7J7JM65_BUGNE|nr:hypothetical protein EB796_015219 [Bugula neritina]